ncbi:MAG TPA: TetR family transcriptional regulator [Streptosporangiaceae bacterium]|nr:TetR family transcriptional regulator [Streptosporangiaceae bacterium]
MPSPPDPPADVPPGPPAGLRERKPPGPPPGLRERKKARTRAEIQRQALRLFREQGYDATTTSQIAEAAEVSESTFFRYFPAKEDVITWDPFDPQLIAAFRAQPAGLSPVAAMRRAMHEVLAELSPAEWQEQRERSGLLLTAMPLRARLVDSAIRGPMRILTDLIAERTGREPSDPLVRSTAGAVIGVGLAAMFAWAEEPETDVVALVDELMTQLEGGLGMAQ